MKKQRWLIREVWRGYAPIDFIATGVLFVIAIYYGWWPRYMFWATCLVLGIVLAAVIYFGLKAMIEAVDVCEQLNGDE